MEVMIRWAVPPHYSPLNNEMGQQNAMPQFFIILCNRFYILNRSKSHIHFTPIITGSFDVMLYTAISQASSAPSYLNIVCVFIFFRSVRQLRGFQGLSLFPWLFSVHAGLYGACICLCVSIIF